MADPVTIGVLAATALSLAAQQVVKGAVGEAVKDAYAALKDRVARWAGDDVKALEKNPASEGRKAVLAEQVNEQPESEQEAVKALATTLMQVLKQEGAKVPSLVPTFLGS
jgi:hypothetical protein